MNLRVEHPEKVPVEYDSLIHRFTHDLRACLRAIATLPDWIREDLDEAGLNLPKDVLRHLDMIEKQAARADHLLGDTRAFYDAILGGRPRAAIDPKEAIDHAIRALDWPERIGVTSQAQSSQLSLPEGYLEQVLELLLRNTIVHSRGTSVEVQVLYDQTSDFIDVIDDGPGIGDSYAERIFEPLVTLQPRDLVEGSGMGLAIARKLAEAWGGSVALIPNHTDRGAHFRISLPSA